MHPHRAIVNPLQPASTQCSADVVCVQQSFHILATSHQFLRYCLCYWSPFLVKLIFPSYILTYPHTFYFFSHSYSLHICTYTLSHTPHCLTHYISTHIPRHNPLITKKASEISQLWQWMQSCMLMGPTGDQEWTEVYKASRPPHIYSLTNTVILH